MINLEALIRQSQELLQELKDGTHELIERSTPATWGELQQKLIDYGIPILKKLYEPIGGLTVIPEVNLPDGVTSTSLVSQSEMVQFVTNTLDTWLVSLMDRVKKASENTIFSFEPIILKTLKKSVVGTVVINCDTSFSLPIVSIRKAV